MKKAVLALVLFLFAGVLAGAPVQLQYVKDVSFVLANARVIHQVMGQVEVENLAYVKSVTVFYTLDGIAWQTTEANYEGSTGGGRDVFTFAIAMPESDYNDGAYGSRMARFAIRYQSAGQTHWDNNGGTDYRVATMGNNMQAPRVVLGCAALRLMGVRSRFDQAAGLWVFEGQVAVKNLGYHKQVAVVYTTDGWASVLTAPAVHSGTWANGVELWSFSVSAAFPADPRYEFAVSYGVNGQVYWDNNTGRNYHLEAGSWIEMDIW